MPFTYLKKKYLSIKVFLTVYLYEHISVRIVSIVHSLIFPY